MKRYGAGGLMHLGARVGNTIFFVFQTKQVMAILLNIFLINTCLIQLKIRKYSKSLYHFELYKLNDDTS